MKTLDSRGDTDRVGKKKSKIIGPLRTDAKITRYRKSGVSQYLKVPSMVREHSMTFKKTDSWVVWGNSTHCSRDRYFRGQPKNRDADKTRCVPKTEPNSEERGIIPHKASQ